MAVMEKLANEWIPNRAETLQVLRLMGDFDAILMLTGADDGYGTRWTLGGQQVQPAIARYLMNHGYIAAAGETEFRAVQLAITPSGKDFRERGLRWWQSLNFLERMKVRVLG